MRRAFLASLAGTAVPAWLAGSSRLNSSWVAHPEHERATHESIGGTHRRLVALSATRLESLALPGPGRPDAKHRPLAAAPVLENKSR